MTSRLITAPAAVVRDILLRPLDLPSWNPAFLEIEGSPVAQTGQAYRLTALRGLRGTFRYDAIEADRIVMVWDVPGLHERCVWTVEPVDDGVRVGHEVERTGPLSILLRPALAGLADLRLDRLQQVAGSSSHPG